MSCSAVELPLDRRSMKEMQQRTPLPFIAADAYLPKAALYAAALVAVCICPSRRLHRYYELPWMERLLHGHFVAAEVSSSFNKRRSSGAEASSVAGYEVPA